MMGRWEAIAAQQRRLTDPGEVQENRLVTVAPSRVTQQTVQLDIFDNFSSIINSNYRIAQKSFCVYV